MEYCGGIFSMAMRARRRSNGGCSEALGVLCHRGGDGDRDSLREVRIRWFHSIRWCMLGAAALRRQVLHGGGLLGVVAYIFSTPYRRRIAFRRHLTGQDKVGSRGNLAYSAPTALQFSVFTRVDALIQLGES
jgi:hypothetical protein